jgi:hypothetical protein
MNILVLMLFAALALLLFGTFVLLLFAVMAVLGFLWSKSDGSSPS